MVSFPTVFTGAATDVEAVRDFMRPIVEPWIEQAWIAIVDPTAKTVTQNSVTGVTTDVSITPLWTGYARVQPLRTDITVKKAVDSTTQRTVQFWPSAWPEDGPAPDLRPGLEIVVMDGKNDPGLEEYKYLIVGSLNSSMAWQRTINTVVNEESRPDYDTSGWPQPGD